MEPGWIPKEGLIHSYFYPWYTSSTARRELCIIQHYTVAAAHIWVSFEASDPEWIQCYSYTHLKISSALYSFKAQSGENKFSKPFSLSAWGPSISGRLLVEIEVGCESWKARMDLGQDHKECLISSFAMIVIKVTGCVFWLSLNNTIKETYVRFVIFVDNCQVALRGDMLDAYLFSKLQPVTCMKRIVNNSVYWILPLNFLHTSSLEEMLRVLSRLYFKFAQWHCFQKFALSLVETMFSSKMLNNENIKYLSLICRSASFSVQVSQLLPVGSAT